MSIPELLTKQQLADHLGVSTRSLDRWIKSGELPPPRRLGNRLVYWHPETIKSWIDNAFTDSKARRRSEKMGR